MKGIYEIAGHVMEIDSLYDRVHGYWEKYRAQGEAEFVVRTKPEDILFEREKSRRCALEEGREPVKASEEYLEELAVYRQVAEKMPEYGTFLFHGSCLAVDGQGVLFTAKSGTGKSTHARLWREYLGDRVVMVNDDKPLIHVEEGKITIYGTPYNGKHGLGNKIAVPLKAICLLERSGENWIKPTTKMDAFPMLVQQAYRPANGTALAKTVTLLDKMAETVKLYRLGVNMSPEAAEMAWRELSSDIGQN